MSWLRYVAGVEAGGRAIDYEELISSGAHLGGNAGPSGANGGASGGASGAAGSKGRGSALGKVTVVLRCSSANHWMYSWATKELGSMGHPEIRVVPVLFNLGMHPCIQTNNQLRRRASTRTAPGCAWLVLREWR